MRILLALLLTVPLFAQKPALSAEGMLADIKTLASDKFEGRGPGSNGEKLTVEFLTQRFKSLALKPGNPNGAYVQDVPMVGLTSKPVPELAVNSKDGKKLALKFGAD